MKQGDLLELGMAKKLAIRQLLLSKYQEAWSKAINVARIFWIFCCYHIFGPISFFMNHPLVEFKIQKSNLIFSTPNLFGAILKIRSLKMYKLLHIMYI